jgi:hypothetical protein
VTRRVILVAVAVVALALAIAFAKTVWWWIEVHTGTAHGGPDPYYNFWSGFGSDLGEATILVALVTAYRHKNCHVKRCPWLGHPVEGTPYLACPKHHPAHDGKRRGVELHVIHAAHRNAKEAA